MADVGQHDPLLGLSQQEFLDLVARRFGMIAEGLDATAAEQTPGLPPRSQIVAEVRAVLGLSAPS